MIVLETDLRRVEAVAFSPLGRHVACGGLGIELWNLNYDREWRWGWEHTPNVPNQYVREVAFVPTSGFLCGIVPDVATYHLRMTDADVREFGIRRAPFSRFVTAPDGRVVLTNSTDLACWMKRPGNSKHFNGDWLLTSETSLGEMVVLPDGNLLIHEVSAGEGQFRVRVIYNGDVARTIKCGFHSLDELRLSPDGSLVVARRGNVLLVWNWEYLHRPPRRVENSSQKAFTAVTFHPSGRYLASASNDHAVTFWDVESWEASRTFNWQGGRMRSIAFSPDGCVAAAGGDAGQLVLFDVDV